MKKLTMKKLEETCAGNRPMCQRLVVFSSLLHLPISFIWNDSLICRVRAFEKVSPK